MMEEFFYIMQEIFGKKYMQKKLQLKMGFTG